MIIPLKDDVPRRTVPFLTLALIGLNVLAFFYQLLLGFDPRGAGEGAAEALVSEFGATPCRITGSCRAVLSRAVEDFPPTWVTIVTSMFLHGSLVHIGGNMLYLWIFGPNVEDTLGHGRFLLFYLAAGVAGAVGQALVSPASAVPMIGASGAISGVLGAYLLLFPYASILMVWIFGFFVRPFHVPAVIVLGLWIVVQLLAGYITFSAWSPGREETGGVAWFAHIGGFLAGMLLLFLLRPRQSRRL
jgi:membrane associated rhomboid family serine protease